MESFRTRIAHKGPLLPVEIMPLSLLIRHGLALSAEKGFMGFDIGLQIQDVGKTVGDNYLVEHLPV